MTLRSLSRVVAGLCTVAALGQSAGAAEPVTVIVGKRAPQLEQFAARELAAQFRRLFGSKVTVTSAPPDDKSQRVVVGSAKTNAVVRGALAGRELSAQGIVLKSATTNGRRTLYVAGGSPKATLWAVYELGYRFGIRYLLREDIYPNTPIPLKLDGIDVAIEPQFRTRTWRTVNDFAIGPESWPLADHKRILRQLAKMKFNRVMISVYPWH
ncbi:MAG: alpha-glucuronidase family glycosyl hydrolase, partial [Planctomycetaceae bacterium]